MTKEQTCGCGHGISRRRVLQAGLAAMAVGAAGDKMNLAAQAGQRGTARQGGARRVDIHAHYFPEKYLNLLNEDGKRFGAEYIKNADGSFSFRSPAGNNMNLAWSFVDMKQRIADMDRQGVDMQAISLTSPMASWGDEAMSSKLASTWNDEASIACKAYPDRLVGLITLPMPFPDVAVQELTRASKLPGMKGAYMGTNVASKDLDNPMFDPVFAKIEEMGLPLFLHPTQPISSPRLQSYYLNNLIGLPLDTTVAAARLIFGGVLDKHPRLEINITHGGGALFSVLGRLDHGWKIRPETKSLPKAPSTYIRRFTYDTCVHSASMMEYVIREVGADRVVLGSDYCFATGDNEPVRFVESLNVSAAQKQMIMGGTAAKILKI